jgi:hypothetical protein
MVCTSNYVAPNTRKPGSCRKLSKNGPPRESLCVQSAAGRRGAGHVLAWVQVCLLNSCLSIVEGRWLRTTDLQGSRRHNPDNILVIVLLWK